VSNSGVSPYKLPLEYRITLLGDSFTFGWGVKEEETFVKILENCLNSSSPSKYHFRVLNLGVPGYSTFQEVAAFKKLVPILKPDLVLLYFVENDFGLPFFLHQGSALTDAISFAKNVWEKTPPDKESEKAFLQSVLDPNRALRDLYQLTEKLKVPLFLTVNPNKKLTSILGRLYFLRERKITPLHIGNELKKAIRVGGYEEKSLSLPTDPHPSPLKHRLIGEAMCLKLQQGMAW
jgi:hypothetical protein